jgi:hypothetical protein
VADESARFEIDLALKGGDQTRAEIASIEQLESTIDSASKSVARMQLAYRNLKVGGLATSQAAKELKTRLDATKKSIGQNQTELLKIRGSLTTHVAATKATTAETKKASSALASLAAGLRLGGGPVADASSRVGALSTALGKAGFVGAALAGVAAVVALDAVVVKAVVSLARMAVVAGDAYRSERLELEGMTKAWVGWRGEVQAGKASDVQGAIDSVAASVPLARERINDLAQSFYQSRLRGENLKQALRAVAEASAATGGRYEDTAKAMIISSAMMGRSIVQTADLFHSRFGAIVSKQMLALPTQLAKARENFSALFRDVRIEPVLLGLRNVLGILDQGTVEFKAWKTILETLFNPLFGGAEEGGRVVEKFVDKVTILALRGAIAWKNMKGSFSLKDIGLESTADLLSAVVRGSTGFAIGLLQATKAAMVLTDVLVGLGGVLVNTVMLFGQLLSAGSAKDFDRLGKKAEDVLGSAKLMLGGGEASNAGFRMIDGLIAGIEKAQPKLNAAVIAVAKETNATFKSAQDMHSPSKVWTGYGFNMGTSAASGFTASIPRFNSAVSRFADAPSAQPLLSGSRDTYQGAQSHVTIGDVHVHSEGKTVEIPVEALRDKLAMILEGLAIQRGART